jgi:hypothetical protein
VIVDLTMLANLPVVDGPDQSPATARKAATAKTARSRKPPARPAPKRKAKKTRVPRLAAKPRKRKGPEKTIVAKETTFRF